MGIVLPRAFEVIEQLRRQSRTAARRFVKLFIDDVWKPFAAAGMQRSEWPAIAKAMERTRPLAAQTLLTTPTQLGNSLSTTMALVGGRQRTAGRRGEPPPPTLALRLVPRSRPSEGARRAAAPHGVDGRSPPDLEAEFAAPVPPVVLCFRR